MKIDTQSGAKVVLAAGGLVALLLSQGCVATRDWANQQLDPLAERVAKNEARLTTAENQLGTMNNRMAGFEVKLAGYDGKIGAMDTKTEKALSALSNLKVERRVVIDMKDGATFKFDSADLPAKAKKEINAMLSDMKNESAGIEGTTFVVAGHTDNSGNPDYNYDLGQKRANAVARYLSTQKATELGGVQVIPVSYGESAPLKANTSSQGRAKNRRVEILVYRDAVTSDTTAASTVQSEPPKTAQAVSQVNHR